MATYRASRSIRAMLAILTLGGPLGAAAVGTEPASEPAAAETAATEGTQAPPDPAAVPEERPPPPVRAAHHARRVSVAQSIDESVRRLSLGLDLDPDQQAKLREILVDQRRQVMRLRGGTVAAQTDMVAATMAIYDQTRARIRAMLTPEQQKKYPAAVPLDQTAQGQADVQKWLQLQASRRRQDSRSAP